MATVDSKPLQVRGSALWARKEWVRHLYGEEGLEKLLAHLSPAGRNLIHAEIDRTQWYNFPLFLDWCIAVDRAFGAGDCKLNAEMARWSAHKNTPSLYSVFIRLGSVDWLLNRSTKLWKEHFNAGTLEVVHEKNATIAEARLTDWPSPHLAHSYSVLGFAVGVIELSGAKNVRGELVSCRSLGGDETLLRVRWGEE
jgi:hypothetical protein